MNEEISTGSSIILSPVGGNWLFQEVCILLRIDWLEASGSRESASATSFKEPFMCCEYRDTSASIKMFANFLPIYSRNTDEI